MRRFVKELANRPFLLPTGQTLTFTHVVDEKGLVEVADDNPGLLAAMLASVGKSGIYEISEAAAEELKKKSPSPKREMPLQKLRLHEVRDDPFSRPPSLLSPSTTTLAQPVLAKPVTAPASAKPAAVESPVAHAEAPANSRPESTYKPRTGHPKAKGHAK